MSDPRSLPAAYDPGRDNRGRFQKGNTASRGWNQEINHRFSALRAMWLDAGAVEDMEQVKNELVKMALTCPQPDVKLKAIIYFMDRTLGRPTESVNLDLTQDGGRPLALPELTAEEVQIIERVVRRTAGDDPQAIAG